METPNYIDLLKKQEIRITSLENLVSALHERVAALVTELQQVTETMQERYASNLQLVSRIEQRVLFHWRERREPLDYKALSRIFNKAARGNLADLIDVVLSRDRVACITKFGGNRIFLPRSASETLSVEETLRITGDDKRLNLSTEPLSEAEERAIEAQIEVSQLIAESQGDKA